MFGEARNLPLSDAQKTKLDALEDQLHDRDPAPREAMKAFATDLAVQIRAGKIDAAKLKADETANDAAMKGMIDKQAKALSGLHDALDGTQRKTLVDAVRAKAATLESKIGERDGGAAKFASRKLEWLSKDLTLDDAQQKQVGAIIAKQTPGNEMQAMRDDRKKQMETLLTAFQADTFDAQKALSTSKPAHDGMEKQVVFVTQLLPILHPDQRERLAVTTERATQGHDRDDLP